MPDGYELLALRVSESGQPLVWESLPVAISNVVSGNESFKVDKTGKAFVNNTFIEGGTLTANYSALMGVSVKSNSELTTREKLSAIVSRYMVGEATECTDGLVSEVIGLFDKTETRRLIDRCIEESIMLNCRPGGKIWSAIRGR